MQFHFHLKRYQTAETYLYAAADRQFNRIYVGGLYGNVSPVGVETIVYSQHQNIEKVLETDPISPQRTMIKRIVECELFIDPMQMKSIHYWLTQALILLLYNSQRTSESNQTHVRKLINQKTNLKNGDSNYAPASAN